MLALRLLLQQHEKTQMALQNTHFNLNLVLTFRREPEDNRLVHCTVWERLSANASPAAQGERDRCVSTPPSASSREQGTNQLEDSSFEESRRHRFLTARP